MARQTLLTRVFQALCSIALASLSGCSLTERPPGLALLNSRSQDQQPALSGDGRWLALVSNRNGSSQIWLYDLQQQRFDELLGVNQGNAIADSPSLSRTARYIAYITSRQGRPDIALYDRATRRSELLTLQYRSWVRNPHISPDGRYIAFETSRRGQWDVEVLDRGPAIELDLPEGAPADSPQP